MSEDIVLTQRFLPDFGGSIKWFFEVYSRWPTQVQLITRSLESSQKETSDNLGSIVLQRKDLFLLDWGLLSYQSLKKYFVMLSAVRSASKSSDCVYVHCAHIVPEALSVVLLRLFGRKVRVLAYVHGEEILAYSTSRELKFLASYTAARADLLIVNSHSTKKLLLEFAPKLETRIEVIHPGVDFKTYNSNLTHRALYREQYGYQESELVLITVARLEEKKNHEAVLRSLVTLRKSHTLKYVIVGDGSLMDQLRQKASSLGLDDIVEFKGEVSEEQKVQLLIASDLHIMPSIVIDSDMEGFGISFIEAAACGLPSIAGMSGGQPEAVQDGKTGFVVDGHNDSAMLEKISLLLSDTCLRQKLSSQAIEYAKGYDWELIKDKTVVLKESLR